ncbi:MAG: cyclic nucleotide-binding domain-containing protein, partial [Candidatus Thiodiazotropha endolucinida]
MPNSKNDDVLLKNLVPLNTLSEDQLGHLLSQIVIEKVKKGEYLFREGDTDHQNIYLLSGTVALLSGQKEMDLISSGTPTARFALAHQLPRKHSAQARTNVSFVRIDSRLLSDMLARSHSASYEVKDIEQPSSDDWMTLLLQSPVFQQIPPANLQRVMMRMEEIKVEEGDVIINQGEEGDYFYLISEGECCVTRSPEAGHAPVELARLRAGKGFGEEALISNKSRGSSVTMMTDGVLVRLSKRDFIELVKQPLSRSVDYERATEMIEKGALWLDVRTPEEYEEGHLPGAINLPFFSLRFQASSLTLDRAYVVYGEEVGQSATAAYLLTERGAEIFVIESNWEQIAELAGMSQQGDTAATNNVIDFNRESEEDADATEGVGVPQSVVDRLQNELSEAHRQFEQELEQRHTEIKLLRQALAVAKSRMQTGEESAKNAQALQQEVASLRESLATAESRLADGESLGAERQDLQDRVEELAQALETARADLDRAKQNHETASQQNDRLNHQLEQLQSRHEENEGRLKEQITELQFQLENANESQQETQQQGSQLSAEIESLKSENSQLRQDADTYRGQSAEEREVILKERDELQQRYQEAEDQHQQQTDELKATRDERDRLAESLEQTHRNMTAEAAELEQQLESIQHELTQAHSELQQQQAERQQQADELQAIAEERDRLTGSLQQTQQSMTEEAAELERKLESTQHELTQAHSELQQQQAERQQQADELQAIAEERDRLTDSLQQTQQ